MEKKKQMFEGWGDKPPEGVTPEEREKARKELDEWWERTRKAKQKLNDYLKSIGEDGI